MGDGGWRMGDVVLAGARGTVGRVRWRARGLRFEEGPWGGRGVGGGEGRGDGCVDSASAARFGWRRRRRWRACFEHCRLLFVFVFGLPLRRPFLSTRGELSGASCQEIWKDI